MAANEFAKRVNEQMKGRVRVDVFPGGSLFNDDDLLIELIKGKSVQMGSPSLCAPGMAHGAQAPFTGLWWSGGDSGVLVF